MIQLVPDMILTVGTMKIGDSLIVDAQNYDSLDAAALEVEKVSKRRYLRVAATCELIRLRNDTNVGVAAYRTHIATARKAIAFGHRGVHPHVVCPRHLIAALGLKGMHGKVMRPLMEHLGFQTAQIDLTWFGFSHKVWVMPGIDPAPDNLRSLLDSTL